MAPGPWPGRAASPSPRLYALRPRGSPEPARPGAAPGARGARRELRGGRPRVPSLRRGKLVGVSAVARPRRAAREAEGGRQRVSAAAVRGPQPSSRRPGFAPPPWGRGSRSPSRPRAVGWEVLVEYWKLGGVRGRPFFCLYPVWLSEAPSLRGFCELQNQAMIIES